MELKKGYKQTEVGVIPEDWQLVSFGNVFDFLTSATYSRAQLTENGIAYYVHYGDIHTKWNHFLDFRENTLPSVTKEQLKSYHLLKEGDLIMADASEDYEGIGKCVEVKNIGDKKVISGLHTFLLRDSCNHFVNGIKGYIYLNSLVKKQFDKLATGLKVYGVSRSNLKLVKIPLPPTKTEQTAIATALSDADALIESLEKLIAKKQHIKQGAMQELLNPMVNGELRMGNYNNSQIKKGWQVKKLGKIFTFHGGYTASREQLSDDGYCYLHYGDIHGAKKTYINLKSDYAIIPKLQVPLKKVSPKSLLNNGDIVFVDASEDDEGTSRHIVVENPDGTPYISGLHTIVAKSKDNSLNNAYKRYCFQSAYIKSQFKFYAVGTKVSGISKTNIAKIEISFPDLEEQTAIATILSDMDAEIMALESKLSKYKQVKQGMMQELLTGKIRLI